MTYEDGGKRLLDLAIAVAAVGVFWPVFAVIALAILLDDGRPVIFRQTRVGASGGEFLINKFRSLEKTSAHVPSHLAGQLRPTTIGQVLRRTNLDELPQLLNIIRGDMSLVGPRPPLLSQTEIVEGRRACGALRTRPGVTGLAQVEAYDEMPAAEKVRWDCVYASQISLRNDAVILLKTVAYLVKPPPTY